MEFVVETDFFELRFWDHRQVQQYFGHLLINNVLVIEFGVVVNASMGLVTGSSDHQELSVETTSQVGLMVVDMGSTPDPIVVGVVWILEGVQNTAQLLVLFLLELVETVVIEGLVPKLFAMVVILQEYIDILDAQAIEEVW